MNTLLPMATVLAIATALAALVTLGSLLRARYRTALQARKMLAQLPEMVELMEICLRAGHTIPVALRLCAQHAVDGPLCALVQRAVVEHGAGRRFDDVLAAIGSRWQATELERWVQLVRSAHHEGGDLAEHLMHFASEIRERRMVNEERSAMQAPVKLLAPLVLLIFPATFLVIAYPILYRLQLQGLWS